MPKTIVVATTGERGDERCAAVARAVADRTGAPVVEMPLAAIDDAALGEYPDPVVVTVPDAAPQVLGAAECPVIVAGPACNGPVLAIENIVVGVAGRERSQAAIALGAECAGACGVRCWLVEVVPDDGLVEAEALESVAERLNREGCTVGWELLVDPDPVRAVCDFARRMPATMLVFGAAADGTLGPIGERLVMDAPGPVMVVRSAAQPAKPRRQNATASSVTRSTDSSRSIK